MKQIGDLSQCVIGEGGHSEETSFKYCYNAGASERVRQAESEFAKVGVQHLSLRPVQHSWTQITLLRLIKILLWFWSIYYLSLSALITARPDFLSTIL